MSNVITLLSDFGIRDSYVAQMKAVLISRAAEHSGGAFPLQIVDITHEVPPQDVLSGARLLREAALRFPPGTVHLAVVDPGVGTGRRIVAVEAGQHFFVAPDNGLLSMVLEGAGGVGAYAVENPELWAPEVSSTFHGRDIMAPVAASLALGGKIAQVGPQVGDLCPLSSPSPDESNANSDTELRLRVIGVDRFGNVLTAADRQQLGSLVKREALRIEIEGKLVNAAMVETYGIAPAGSLVALFGSQGFLELAVVNGSAAGELGVQAGDWLRIHGDKIRELPR